MRLYGLIGYPLSHSFSARYFGEKFKREHIKNVAYDLFPIENIELLPGLIAGNPALCGLNVTIPYKEKVLPYLSDAEESIGEIGAVNTIKIFRNGESIRLRGFNTDTYGFAASLKPLVGEKHRGALVLGTGGASKAVGYVLKQWGIHVIFVSRKPSKPNQISYEMINGEIMAENKLIINTSPVGMYPLIHELPPLPYDKITGDHILYDLVYNPELTAFLAEGKNKGAVTLNGLSMLGLQAEKAWEIWNSEV